MLKNKTLVTLNLTAALMTLVPLLALPATQVSAAAAGKLYFSPASQSLQAGSNLTLNVVMDTGGSTVNGVLTTITFSSNFSYVSITGDSSSLVFLPSVSGNTVNFSEGYPPTTVNGSTVQGVNGVRTVATLTLHANSAGSGALSFASICQDTSGSNCSALTDGNVGYQNDLGSISSGSYTITAPPSGGTGGTTGGSSGGSSGGGGSPASGNKSSGSKSSVPSTPTPTPVSAAPAPAPKISNVKVTNIGDTQATITWQTDVPASSIVSYGQSAVLGFSAQTGGMTTNHSVTLGAPYIVKGATYYFEVVSAAPGGATSTSQKQQFSTPGFDVTILIVNSQHQPLSGISVTLGGKTLKTNAQGEVVFQNVPAGNQAVSVVSGGKTVKQFIQVGKYDPTTNSYVQQKFSLTAKPSSAMTWVYILVAVVVVIAVLVIVRPFPGNFGSGGPFSRLLPPSLRPSAPGMPDGMISPIVMPPSGQNPIIPPAAPAGAVSPNPTPAPPAARPVTPAHNDQQPGAVIAPQDHQTP